MAFVKVMFAKVGFGSKSETRRILDTVLTLSKIDSSVGFSLHQQGIYPESDAPSLGEKGLRAELKSFGRRCLHALGVPSGELT